MNMYLVLTYDYNDVHELVGIFDDKIKAIEAYKRARSVMHHKYHDYNPEKPIVNSDHGHVRKFKVNKYMGL
jgi:hypothetical protein